MNETKEEIVKQAETEAKTEAKTEAETEQADNLSDEKTSANGSDIELLNGIIKKYGLTVLEQKVIGKVVSLLETTKTRQMLPDQNIGDSVFKMYASDDQPTEFLVDRIEFDNQGWKLVSYEKFGTCEVEFIFAEKDYNKFFFDTAEDAKAFYNKK